MSELVGILNITPDSFSGEGKQNLDVSQAVEQAEKMLEDGAAFIDVGAESTRPGFEPISYRQEIMRLAPFLTEAAERNLPLSIDSRNPMTMRFAYQKIGNFILNDVTNMQDPYMRLIAAESGMPVIMSHIPERTASTFESVHEQPKIDSFQQVIDEIHERIEVVVADGIEKENIIVDPGIGFGKTRNLNWELLSIAEHFPEFKTMVGYSRKKFLGERHKEIVPNIQAGRIAVAAGTTYLRVHDVKGHAINLGV